MKSPSLWDGSARNKLLLTVLLALCAGLMFGAQIVLAPLANIELVSLLTILYAKIFKKHVFTILAVFILLEGLLYGFGIWWISYLYIWVILAGVALLLHHLNSAILWAIISGAYGFAFGALCAIPYFFMGGVPAAAAYWIAGIPFDIAHCIGNFVLCLLLYHPLRIALDKLMAKIKQLDT